MCLLSIYTVHKNSLHFPDFCRSWAPAYKTGSIHYFGELLILMCRHRKTHTNTHTHTLFQRHPITSDRLTYRYCCCVHWTLLSAQLNVNRLNEVKTHKRHFRQVEFNYGKSIKLLDKLLMDKIYCMCWLHTIKMLNEYGQRNVFR